MVNLSHAYTKKLGSEYFNDLLEKQVNPFKFLSVELKVNVIHNSTKCKLNGREKWKKTSH